VAVDTADPPTGKLPVPVVVGAAVVPAAPLLLPDASPQQPDPDRSAVARLRARVDETLGALPDADVIVLIAPGPRGVHDRARASLRPLGIAREDVSLSVDRKLVPHTTRLTQYPLALGGDLGIEHTILVRLIHALRPDATVLPVSVAPSTDGGVLINVGASLVEALRDAGRTGAFVAAADLSAALTETSPGYLADGAADWDRRLVGAFTRRDTAAVAGLGPHDAARMRAIGWAALTVLAGATAVARLAVAGDLRYDVVRGVGRLTGRFLPTGQGDAGEAFRRAGTPPLTLPRDAEA
jgi:hypothetical protein